MTIVETIKQILLQAQELGVELYLEGGRLGIGTVDANVSQAFLNVLREHKEALSAHLLVHSGSPAALPDIVARGAGESAPLSFVQEGMWLDSRRYGDTPRYHMAIAGTLRGPLDRERVGAVFAVLAERHQVLRVTIKEAAGTARQHVAASVSIPVRFHDLSPAAGATCRSRARELIGLSTYEPFDLEHGPLLRGSVMTLSADEHIVGIHAHHIIFDQISAEILLREFVGLYDGGLTPAALRPLTHQYLDYAAWERSWLTPAVIEFETRLWKDKLEAFRPVLCIEADRPRTAQTGSDGMMFSQTLGPSALAAMKATCADNGVTMFMFMQTAFALLVHKLTGSGSVLLGNTVAGRSQQVLQGVVGCFVNIIPVITSFEPEQTFEQVLSANKKTIVNTYAKQFMPFASILSGLLPRAGDAPWVRTVINMMTGKRESPPLTAIDSDTDIVVRYDLEVHIQHAGEELSIYWAFNRAVFDLQTIKDLAARFDALLKRLVSAPATRIKDITVLRDAEERLLLESWCSTGAPYTDTRSLMDHVLDQIQANPGKLAVVDGERYLNYGDLGGAVGSFSAFLGATGVMPGDVVVLALERSLETVIAILAIASRGAVCVPLHADNPAHRNALIVRDVGAKVVLSTGAGCEQFDELPLTVVDLAVGAAARALSVKNAAPATSIPVAPASPVFMFHTSGSTGAPKAVQVTHANILNLVKGRSSIALAPTDIVAQVSNYAFDAFSYELWGSLTNGASLVLVPQQSLLDFAELKRLIDRHGITVLFMTTALFNRVASENPACVASLQRLLFGGEQCSTSAVRQFLASQPDTTLIHVYGPTECTTFATYYVFDPQRFSRDERAPIGKPLDGVQCYVLDEHGNLVPPGASGELYVGGAGVTAGYAGQPELTATRFVAARFPGAFGPRLYRTGDRVRWLPDGSLEYQGRLDRQIKLRGFRIELEEIEFHLSGLELVRESAVEHVVTARGDAHLVAYVVINAAEATARGLLQGAGTASWDKACGDLIKGELGQYMPDYMIPTRVRVLDAMPLNVNGKIDRYRLPSLRDDEADMPLDMSSLSATEAAICAVWRTLLEVKQVGASDDFFDLGGNSLTAISLLNDLRERFGVEVSLKQFFATPTVAMLASSIDAAREVQMQVRTGASAMAREAARTVTGEL